MRDELLEYYDRELRYLRTMGADFAEKYPGVAARLALSAEVSPDPHVERLLQGFAFLAARVRLKIDDDLPEITESLLELLHPHYVRPIPSMSIVEFTVDPRQTRLSTVFKVPSSSMLYSKPVDGVPCKFRTCYATDLWPLRVEQAKWTTPDRLSPEVKAEGAFAACRIALQCEADLRFDKLDVRSLRFHLTGSQSGVYTLYELLFNNCFRVFARDPDGPKNQPGVELSLGAVGFRDDEAMLPYSHRSFIGYRLLQEYFAFPEKFLFFELTGMEALTRAKFGPRAEIVFMIKPFERADRHEALEEEVNARTFRLNCCPIVNLFPHSAESIHLDQTRHEYPVIPDLRRRNALEIFSVDEVFSSNPRHKEIIPFDPMYSHMHSPLDTAAKAHWKISRRPSGRKNDDGTEVWISIADPNGRAARDGVETLTVRCTCTNRSLASRLPFGADSTDFELEGVSLVKQIVALRKPTPSLRPSTGKGRLWSLISQLSLNYLSLVEEGKDALKEILRLYNFSDSVSMGRQIDGIVAIKSSRKVARVVSEHGINFARGTAVDLELDEEFFVGGSAYLFAAVLESFFALYVSLNSFSQLSVRTRQRKEELKIWPPKAGTRILL